MPFQVYRCSYTRIQWQAISSISLAVKSQKKAKILFHHSLKHFVLNEKTLNQPQVSAALNLQYQMRGQLTIKQNHTIDGPPLLMVQFDNAHLIKIKVLYDHIKRIIVNPQNDTSICHIHKKYCKGGHNAFVWKIPTLIDCPFTHKNKTDLALLHFDLQNQLYRLELLKYGVSMYFQDPCPKYVDWCFRSNVICDHSGLIIETLTCKDLISLPKSQHVSPVRIPSFAYFASSRSEEFTTENNDLINEAFQHLTVELNFMQCEIESLFATLFHLLGRLYPGQILFTLSGTPTTGKTTGDLIVRIFCEPIHVTLLCALYFNGKFSSRPLIHFANRLNETVVGPIHRDGFVYAGIALFETYRPGKVVTFHILDHFYVFQNYFFTHRHHIVTKLSSSLQTI